MIINLNTVTAAISQHPFFVLGGGAATILTSLAWWALVKYMPAIIVGHVMSHIDLSLQGKKADGRPIADPDDRLLVARVFAALVEWAEKKIPDDGLGPQRLQLVLAKIYSTAGLLPIIGPRIAAGLRANEPMLIEFINALVKKMNDRLQKDVPPTPVSPPRGAP